MEYPNKTFITEIHTEFMGSKIFKVVVVVAKNVDVAVQHLKDTIGFKGNKNNLTWLMDTNHRTIYDQRGDKPLEVQAKIMYNVSNVYPS